MTVGDGMGYFREAITSALSPFTSPRIASQVGRCGCGMQSDMLTFVVSMI